MFKKILFFLCLSLAMFSCSEDNDVALDNLELGFFYNKIETGENSATLDVLVSLEGVSRDVKLDLAANVEAIDGTAKSGVDYLLEETKISFSKTGKLIIPVKIIDNDVVENLDEPKTFTLRLIDLPKGVKSAQNEIVVSIIDDDQDKFYLEGDYTLFVSDFTTSEVYSSEPGAVKIEKSEDDPKLYTISNIHITNKQGLISPFTIDEHWTMRKESSSEMSLLIDQPLGKIGNGAGILVEILDNEGHLKQREMSITRSRNVLSFNVFAIAGVEENEDKQLQLYYIYKNVKLVKVN